MPGQRQIEQYHEEGYFIADDAVEPPMLEELAAAARRVVDRIRSGEVVDDEDGVGTGGPGAEPAFVTGLMAPEFGEPVFAEYLGSEEVAPASDPSWATSCAWDGCTCAPLPGTTGATGTGTWAARTGTPATRRRWRSSPGIGSTS